MDDLLDVSRVTRGLVHLEMEAIHLEEVIGSAVEQVRHLARIPAYVLCVQFKMLSTGGEGRLAQIEAALGLDPIEPPPHQQRKRHRRPE